MTVESVGVSIVVTAYNYAGYIMECLDSCLAQTAAGVQHEVIVVDDGSTDDTQSVLSAVRDPRVRTFRIENSGIEAASNVGLAEARGKYIVRVDADDRLSPDYLGRMMKEVSEPCGFFYPDYVVIDGTGAIVGHMDLPEFDPSEIRRRGDFCATATLYTAAALKKVGGYSTLVRNSGLENYELILTMLEAGIVGKHVPDRLWYYRRHETSFSETKKARIVRNGQALFERMGLGTFQTNEYHPHQLRTA